MSDPRPSSLPEMARRAVRLGRKLTTRRQTSPAQQRVVLGVSAVVFLGATVLAWRSLPDIDGRVHWWAFVLVAVLGVPASIWNRGAEFGAIARLTGEHIGIAERVRVAVVGTAANMLPVPGSVVVRGEVLRRRGVALRAIGWATAIAAAVWAGSTALVAGSLLAAMSEHVLLGVVLAVGGAAVCAGSTYSVVSRPSVQDPWRAMAHLVVVEVVSIVLGGLRLWGVLAGLGYSAGIDQAVALTVAGLVSTAVGFAPAGLGVRELAAAAISPLVGLPTSLGLLAAAINRLVELVVLAPASVALVVRRPGSPAEVLDASGIETGSGEVGAAPGPEAATSPPTAVEAAES